MDYRKKTPNMLGTIMEEPSRTTMASIAVNFPKKDKGNNDDEEDEPRARTYSNTFQVTDLEESQPKVIVKKEENREPSFLR